MKSAVFGVILVLSLTVVLGLPARKKRDTAEVTCGDGTVLTCDEHAVCDDGSNTCVCAEGYEGDGQECDEIDDDDSDTDDDDSDNTDDDDDGSDSTDDDDDDSDSTDDDDDDDSDGTDTVDDEVRRR